MAMSDRGFASMSKDKQRAIAVKGGKAAYAAGTAHKWTAEEAREAGRKGGRARHPIGRRHPVAEGSLDEREVSLPIVEGEVVDATRR